MDEADAARRELTGQDLAGWHVDEEWLVSVCLLGEACVAARNREQAEILYELLLRYGSLNAVAIPEMTLGATGRPLGVLATLLGDFDQAVRHFEEALRMDTRMGARPWVAHTQHAYAGMLAARGGGSGDRQRALELAGRAREGYRGLGMETFAAGALRLERSLSRRGPKR